MNRPECLLSLEELQVRLLAFLQVLGKPRTFFELQLDFPGVSGDLLRAALDALIVAGVVEEINNPSPLVPLLESLPSYRAVNPDGGPDHA